MSRTFSVTSASTFTIEKMPSPGQALVVTEFAGRDELQHVAADRDAAERWLAENRYHNARIDIVPPASNGLLALAA